MTPEELEAANANGRAEALRGALSHRGRRYPPLDRPTHPSALNPAAPTFAQSPNNGHAVPSLLRDGVSNPPSGENA